MCQTTDHGTPGLRADVATPGRASGAMPGPVGPGRCRALSGPVKLAGISARGDTLRRCTGRRIGPTGSDQGTDSGAIPSGPVGAVLTAGGYRADVRAHGPTADGSGPHAGPWSHARGPVGPELDCQGVRTEFVRRPDRICSAGRTSGAPRSGARSGTDSQIPMHPRIPMHGRTRSEINLAQIQIPMHPGQAGSGSQIQIPMHFGVDFVSRMGVRSTGRNEIKEER